jgi:hypothetical protein
MSSTDPAKVFTDFWTVQGQSFLNAQQQATKAIADGMQALASGTLPAMPGLPTDISASAADLSHASQAMMALWSAATSLSGTLVKLTPSVAATGNIAPGETTVEATFRKMVDPRNWLAGTGEMDEVLGRMAEGPRFADLWEIERRYAHVLQAWMTVRRRGLEHNAVVLEAWLKAGRRFSEELVGQTRQGEGSLDAKALLALWTETANRQLLEMQHSEPFLRTQAAMIRATTELRMAQQELVEHFGKQYGFPTHTELDDVHRTVTELRREMRAMRREQRIAPQAEVPSPAPAGRPPVTRRATNTKRGTR